MPEMLNDAFEFILICEMSNELRNGEPYFDSLFKKPIEVNRIQERRRRLTEPKKEKKGEKNKISVRWKIWLYDCFEFCICHVCALFI